MGRDARTNGVRRQVLAVLGAAAAAAGVLLRFPPERYGVYPVCPVHAWTGLLCPGCGATRALAALLRGDLAGAVQRNGLLVLFVLPCVAAWTGYVLWRGRWPEVSAWVVYAGLALAAGFAVLRNFG